MLLYLSGPMTGLPDHNYPTFDAATAALRMQGYEVINPAETAGGTTRLPRATFLRIDIGYVLASDMVVLLPGWDKSSGSKLEIAIANAVDIPVRFLDGNYTPETVDRIVSLEAHLAIPLPAEAF